MTRCNGDVAHVYLIVAQTVQRQEWYVLCVVL